MINKKNKRKNRKSLLLYYWDAVPNPGIFKKQKAI